MEDIDFNVSEPVTILFQDGKLATGSSIFGDELFPDEVLREAVRKQVGETYDALAGFKGTLDLSGTNVADLTGINYLGNMTGLNLENCTKLISVNLTQYTEVTVNVAGCTNLERLFMSGTQQTSLDIRGVNKLKEFDISNSQISALEADDASKYTSAIVWTWDNARMDLSDDTPEGKLKAGMEAYFASGNIIPDFSSREEVLYRKDDSQELWYDNYNLGDELSTPGRITSVSYEGTFYGYESTRPTFYDLSGGKLYTIFEKGTEEPKQSEFVIPEQQAGGVVINTGGVPASRYWIIAEKPYSDSYV